MAFSHLFRSGRHRPGLVAFERLLAVVPWRSTSAPRVEHPAPVRILWSGVRVSWYRRHRLRPAPIADPAERHQACYDVWLAMGRLEQPRRIRVGADAGRSSKSLLAVARIVGPAAGGRSLRNRQFVIPDAFVTPLSDIVADSKREFRRPLIHYRTPRSVGASNNSALSASKCRGSHWASSLSSR